jgi:hypothetical protein
LGLSYIDFQERVMAKVDMSDVPGMSPMDIDGVDGAAIDNISTVISFLTVRCDATTSCTLNYQQPVHIDT